MGFREFTGALDGEAGGFVEFDGALDPVDDGSFDRAEATRLATQGGQRADRNAADRVAGYASEVAADPYGAARRRAAPAPVVPPPGAGVMWDGLTDQQRRDQRVQEVGFRALMEQEAAARPADVATGIKPGALQQIGDTVRRGLQRAGQGFDVAGAQLGTLAPDAAGRRFAQRQRRIEAAAPSTEIAAGMQAIGEAATFGEAFRAMGGNPLATLTLLGESVIASTPALATAVAGGALGPWGAAAGGGVGSFAVEFSASVVDYLQDKGLDPRDPQAIARALTDPTMMREARGYAVKRGIPIAAFDALSAGMAGRFVGPVLSDATAGAGRLALASGAEITLQAGSAATGESLAQAATNQFKPADIVLEALADVPGGAVEAASNVARQRPVAPLAPDLAAGAAVPPQAPMQGPSTPATAQPPFADPASVVLQAQSRPAPWGASAPAATIGPAGLTVLPQGAPGLTQTAADMAGAGLTVPGLTTAAVAANPAAAPQVQAMQAAQQAQEEGDATADQATEQPAGAAQQGAGTAPAAIQPAPAAPPAAAAAPGAAVRAAQGDADGGAGVAAPPANPMLYEGKGGRVYDEEALQRRNLGGVTLTNAGALMGDDTANLFKQAIEKEARESFDVDGKFIGKGKFRVVTKRGVAMFEDADEAKAFADSYGQKKDKPVEQNQRYAEGMEAARAGKPRDLPVYIGRPRSDDAKAWFAGWDAAAGPATPSAEAAPTEAEATPADPRLANPDAQQALNAMAGNVGWAEQGGRLLRENADDEFSAVVGRTKWVPNAEWWPTISPNARIQNPRDAQAAVQKAIRGDKLSAKERRFVGELLDIYEAEEAPRRAEQAAAEEEARLEREAIQAEAAETLADLPLTDVGLDDLVRQSDAASAMRALGFSDEEVAAAATPADARGKGQARPGDLAPENAAESGAAAGDRAGEAPAAEAQGDFGLDNPTPESLQRRQAEQERADEERRQRENAPPPDDFVLTGSNRDVDQAAARGQTGLFDAATAAPPRAADKPADTQGARDDFVPAPDGGRDYGAITPDMAKAMRRQAGPIRLQYGDESFGLRHIEERHGAQIRGEGFASVEAFVAEVAGNIDQVWKPQATTQLIAVEQADRDRLMFIQLQPADDGDYYTVRTAFPARKDYAGRKGWELLWEGAGEVAPTTSGESTPFAAPSRSPGETATNASGQSSTDSVAPDQPAPEPIPAESDEPTAEQRANFERQQEIMRSLPSNIGKAKQEGKLSARQRDLLDELTRLERELPNTSAAWKAIYGEARATSDAERAKWKADRVAAARKRIADAGFKEGQRVEFVATSFILGGGSTRYEGVIRVSPNGNVSVHTGSGALDLFRNPWRPVKDEPAPEAQQAAAAAPDGESIEDRIAAAERNGVVLSANDKARIRDLANDAAVLRKRADRWSAAGADPMNKGNAFPMGVGFTKMTKRKEQAIDASVRKAGESLKFAEQARAKQAQVERLLAGKDTDAAKETQAGRQAAARRKLVETLLQWQPGTKLGRYTVERVSNDRDGYPSSYTISGEGIVKGVQDKVDIAREHFGGDKAALRALVDELRPAEAPAATAPSAPLTLASFDTFRGQLRAGEVTLDQFKQQWEAFKAGMPLLRDEIERMTKAAIFEKYPGLQYRYKNDKKDRVVQALVTGLMDDFNPADRMISYNMAEAGNYVATLTRKMDEIVAKTTAEDLAKYAEKFAADQAERRQRMDKYRSAIENPQTIEDFDIVRRLGRLGQLTPEQRRRYEDLTAEATREQRTAEQAQRATVQGVQASAATSDIIQTKHTRDGYDLFVVQLSDRVPTDEYKRLNEIARRLGGWYSSFRGNGATPGFQFKARAQAEQFKQALAGETIAGEDRQAAKTEKRQEAAVEKLRAMAEKLKADADDSLGRDRLTNTAKRARQASAAEDDARRAQQLAETMANLADAIESGDAVHLSGLRTKAQVEQLESAVRAAKTRELRAKYPSYADEQKHQGEPATIETIDYAEYPATNADRSDLLSTAGYLEESGKPGVKLLAGRLRKLAASMGPESRQPMPLEWAQDALDKLAGTQLVRRLPWYWGEMIDRRKRLAAMGIENETMYRAALREFVAFRGKLSEADKAKLLERGLVGKKVGVDFFPTPKAVADDMVERAGIEKGMRVLEPEGGSGNIAQAIRDAGAEPDVAEVSSTLREVLEAKGFNLVAHDFMEFAPDKPYDRIVMNPPFGGGADMRHVQHAYGMLAPGGRLVAIVGEGAFGRSDKQATEFRAWLDSIGAEVEKLPEGTFTDKTLLATTGANARMVVIDKPAVADGMAFETRMAPAQAAVTDTPEFRRWFGDSKVVDAEGKPLVVYHGTGADIESFKPGLSNALYFTPDADLASQYTKRLGRNELKDGGNVMPVYLRLTNPKIIKGTLKRERWLDTAYFRPEQIAELKAQGHDGVINEDASEIIVFDPEQIKSATGNRGTFDPASGNILDSRMAPGLYSALEQSVGALNMRAAQPRDWIENIQAMTKRGVKPDEIEWSGVLDWIGLQQGKVSKQQVLDYLAQNGVRVEESVLDPNDVRSVGRPKFGQYTVPGGQFYREVLLTLPTPADQRAALDRASAAARRRMLTTDDMAAVEAGRQVPAFRSNHWDQPNVLAHVRVDDRTDADGKRVLFVNEVQGDWPQKLRKQRSAIEKAVDSDFQGIVARMEKAGVLKVECD